MTWDETLQLRIKNYKTKTFGPSSLFRIKIVYCRWRRTSNPTYFRLETVHCIMWGRALINQSGQEIFQFILFSSSVAMCGPFSKKLWWITLAVDHKIINITFKMSLTNTDAKGFWTLLSHAMKNGHVFRELKRNVKVPLKSVRRCNANADSCISQHVRVSNRSVCVAVIIYLAF